MKGIVITLTRQLAEFVTETSYDDLPAQTVDHAAMLIASTLASAACGVEIPSARIIRELAQERGGRPDATVWFAPGPKLPVVSAARANALMSDAAASDDSDLRNITHAGTPLTAASLAMAELTGANGRDVLTGVVLGYEVAGRIGASITPIFRQKGFHACLIATFSGAVATGRLLGQDATQMANTIALSATSIGGLIAAGNASVSREYHAGLATLLGIEAAMAAGRGFAGEERILEMPGGFCSVYGDSDGADIALNWGQEWDIVTD
ncbi:MAG: MmgE/PrpD family protein, partial [Proteobacteria bacterium]|nr:MmgE/PrpD family protein [Pseudomonadota bacterium]